MKKAFTLIELMITILLTTIFLNFIFRFYSNVLIEVRYLEAKDSLTYNAFRAMQIVKNGVQGNDSYIGGVVTLNTRNSDTNFSSYNGGTVSVNTDDGNLTITDGSTNLYRFEGIDINRTNFSLRHISNNLFIFEFNATQNSIFTGSELNQTETITYQRLVYTR